MTRILIGGIPPTAFLKMRYNRGDAMERAKREQAQSVKLETTESGIVLASGPTLGQVLQAVAAGMTAEPEGVDPAPGGKVTKH